LRTIEIEFYVASHFGWRDNVVVPNVSWGLGLHECDLVVLKPSGYLWEVEIKVSAADLRRDKDKRHGHASNKIARLYFAIPKRLEKCVPDIDARAGVLIVEDKGYTKLVRVPQTNKAARKLTESERVKLYELASMRMWTLKRKLMDKMRRDWK